jgi:hypothetical protein
VDSLARVIVHSATSLLASLSDLTLPPAPESQTLLKTCTCFAIGLHPISGVRAFLRFGFLRAPAMRVVVIVLSTQRQSEHTPYLPGVTASL